MKWNKADLKFEAYLPTSILKNIAERNMTFYFHNHPTFNIYVTDKKILFWFILSHFQNFYMKIFLPSNIVFSINGSCAFMYKKHESK